MYSPEGQELLRCRCVSGNWNRQEGLALFGYFHTEQSLAIRVPDQGGCWGRQPCWPESRTLNEALFVFVLFSFHRTSMCLCGGPGDREDCTLLSGLGAGLVNDVSACVSVQTPLSAFLAAPPC